MQISEVNFNSKFPLTTVWKSMQNYKQHDIIHVFILRGINKSIPFIARFV